MYIKPKEEIIIKCAICGKEFIWTKYKRKYCCEACKEIAKNLQLKNITIKKESLNFKTEKLSVLYVVKNFYKLKGIKNTVVKNVLKKRTLLLKSYPVLEEKTN